MTTAAKPGTASAKQTTRLTGQMLIDAYLDEREASGDVDHRTAITTVTERFADALTAWDDPRMIVECIVHVYLGAAVVHLFSRGDTTPSHA